MKRKMNIGRKAEKDHGYLVKTAHKGKCRSLCAVTGARDPKRALEVMVPDARRDDDAGGHLVVAG
jgi:hypothetical protein